MLQQPEVLKSTQSLNLKYRLSMCRGVISVHCSLYHDEEGRSCLRLVSNAEQKNLSHNEMQPLRFCKMMPVSCSNTVLVQTELWLKPILHISVLSGEKVSTLDLALYSRDKIEPETNLQGKIKERLCSPVCWPDRRRVTGEQMPWSGVTFNHRKLNVH